MKAIYFKTILSVSLVLTSLVSVEGTEDTHLRYSHDDNGRASPPVVLADEGIQRRLQVPPSNDPRTFFYGRVWFDNNANSKMDDGEEGMPRVQVSLWRADLVAAIKSRTTDENGYFEFPLKSFRKRVARTYYLQLEMKDEKKERYVFFRGGDSKVDESGKSESVVIPKLTTTGGRYEIYAGVRAKTAVFYGTMWFDNNGNDMMDEAEERVLRNPLSLLRTENGEVDENVQEKRTGKNTGTYEISLDEYDLDTTYKYFPEFRLPPDYIFVTAGDSHVDRDGRGVPTSAARGRRYKVNAGIRRPMSGVVFYGRMWYDDDEDGIIGTGEEGVPNAEVSLFGKPRDKPLVKRVYTLDDGTFELNLKKMDPNLSYYLRFQDQTGHVRFLDHVGESNVDSGGRTDAISLEDQKRYKLNAGVTCPAIRAEAVEQAISELEGFWQNITTQYEELTAEVSGDAFVVFDNEEAIEDITDVLELHDQDAEMYMSYLRELYVIERCDLLLPLKYINSDLDSSMSSLAVVSPDGILKFEPIIDIFPIAPELNATMPDPTIPLDGAEPEGTRSLQRIQFPKTFDVTKEWIFNPGWGNKVECYLNVQVITNDLCTGAFSSTFVSDPRFPLQVTPPNAIPPVTTWNQANPRCPGKTMECGLVNFPFTVTQELNLVIFSAKMIARTFILGTWVCANGSRDMPW
jgi:hypothetical protein